MTVSHYVAYALLPHSSQKGFDMKYSRRLQHHLATKTTDYCNCACSLTGCTPLLLFLRGFEEWFLGNDASSIARRTKSLFLIRSFLLEDMLNPLHQHSLELIRVATFRAFELTHTCCRRVWMSKTSSQPPSPRFEKAEVDEIQDEERLLMSQFESTVDGLEQLYQLRGIPLPAFFHTSWKDRMLELMPKDSEMNEVDVQGLNSIGVKVLKTADKKSKQKSDAEWYDNNTFLKLPTPYRFINLWLELFDESKLAAS